MAQHQEKLSLNQTQSSAANANTNAIQLKDNRESHTAQKKLQKKAIGQESTFKPIQKKANNTGLPNNLKSGIENLSGHSMDDVKVHYNSDKPAQLNAHAYAQGSNIHIASRQEKHLPHEVWHVVQQKQGRVKPTLQMKDKANATENKSLGTVQRMTIEPAHNALEMLGNDQKTVAKFNTLIRIMRHALQHDFPKDSIEIEVTNKGEITPAWNHHKGTAFRPGNPGSIGVQLNRWYLEKVSIGNLIGMFIHEIGVHTFADKKMGLKMSELGTPHSDPDSDWRKERYDQTNDHHNQINGTIERFPNAAEAANTGRARQRDHVNLAKSLAGGLSSRSQKYIALYLASGDSIVKKVHGEEKDQALKELTYSFLFDLGRLAATDDGGPISIFKNAGAIGQLMKFYGDNIVEKHKKTHKWLKKAAANIKTGAWPIRIFLLGQLGTLAISSNPIAKKGRRSLAGGIIGSGIALVAGATALPALAVGLGVAFGLHYFQKRFGV